jgi:Fur family peroxide stress response transcriptional regulator
MEYSNLLKKYDLKITPQRLQILKKLDEEGHLSVDDLFITLRETFLSISLATIYKNINIMSQKQVIQEVKIPNQKSVYEISKHEHSHMVCSSCESIYDLTLNTDNLVSQVNSLSNFQVKGSVVLFNGICSKCL